VWLRNTEIGDTCIPTMLIYIHLRYIHTNPDIIEHERLVNPLHVCGYF